MLKIIFPIVGLLLGVLLILQLVLLWTRKKQRKAPADIIIFFADQAKAPDIRKNNEMMAIADWRSYGDYHYRGFCSVGKKTLEERLIRLYGLTKDDFKLVYPGNLYWLRMRER